MHEDRDSTPRRAVADPFRGLLLLAVLSGASGLPGSPAAATAQQRAQPTRLQPRHPISRELAGGGTHSYRVALRAGQYLHAVVEQRGIDVLVTIFAPDGEEVADFDTDNGAQGPEKIRFVGQASGDHRLEVSSLDSTASPGRYEVRIDTLRPGTDRDRAQVSAERLYRDAVRLEAQGTAEGFRDAIAKYGEALPLFLAAGDSSRAAYTLNNMASAQEDLGDGRQAIAPFTRALELFFALGDSSSAATILNNLGLTHDHLGEKQRALEFYRRALPIRRAVGDSGGEAITLNNLGQVYAHVGRNREALDVSTQALAIYRELEDRRSLAVLYSNIGVIYDRMGEKQQALDSYAQSLELRRAVGDSMGQVSALLNIGALYEGLGEHRMSLDFYVRARELFHAAGNPRGEATALNNIGSLHDMAGEHQLALEAYGQALARYRQAGDQGGEAKSLNNIGASLGDAGRQREAIDSLDQAMRLFRAVSDRSGEAAAINNRGDMYFAMGERRKAAASYADALRIRRTIGDRRGEAGTLWGLALLAHQEGDFRGSLTSIEAALAVVDTVRTRIGSQGLRASYLATVQSYRELHIDVLMKLDRQHPGQGYAARALLASEHAKARSLLETLAEAHADIRQGVDSTLLARERSLQQDLNLEAGRQEALLAGPHTEAEVEAGDRALEALTADLRQVEAAIKATSPRYAALALPEPLDLEAMRRQLDPGTMLLEYSLGPKRSYLWAITRKEITGHQLPGRAELDTAVRRFHALVSSTQAVVLRGERGRPLAPKVPQREMLDVALALSRMLLGPVADRLGTQRLVIVADGILSYLPFGSLPDPVTLPPDGGTVQPLIVRHEIVSLPSLSVLALLRQQPAGRLPPPRTIAVVADPVFYADDERVRRPAAEPSRPASPEVVSRLESTVERSAEEAGARRGGERLPRLPGTRKEADGILALMPDSAQTTRAVDFEASRAFATSGELSRYRYVHFATHGLLNSLHPELTAIVLSLVDAEGRPQDGFLRAHEIYNLQLSAEAVVLSACQTGLGKEVKGEGLIGLTRGFLYAGAKRVVVSLWSVDDEATAELMVRFYRGVMKGKPPAQALRTAQLEMWKGRRWQAPYYWAAFVLHGEWR